MLKNQLNWAFRNDAGGPIRTLPMYYIRVSKTTETLAQWLHKQRAKIWTQPAKGCTYLGWIVAGQIMPILSLTKKAFERVQALVPNEIPRYVRCYDRGPDAIPTDRRYTVVYSGRNGKGQFLFSDADANIQRGRMTNRLGDDEHARLDTNTSGFSTPKGRRHPELGLHIPFEQLPDALKKIVLDDYWAAWKLPLTIEMAQLEENRKVKGFREVFPHPDDTPLPEAQEEFNEPATLSGEYEQLGKGHDIEDDDKVEIDLTTPEHHVHTGPLDSAPTITFCGREGNEIGASISIEFFDSNPPLPICPECEEAIEVMRAKGKTVTVSEETMSKLVSNAGFVEAPARRKVGPFRTGDDLTEEERAEGTVMTNTLLPGKD